MIKVAIQNIHLAPNINDIGIHNYILELVLQGFAPYLYFDCQDKIENILSIYRVKYKFLLPFDNTKVNIISTENDLNKCDVLLNFNTFTKAHDFTNAVKKFNGLKIWHVGDYFWNEPGSEINKRYEDYGVDYLFGYASHDKHCSYFRKTFPKYINKVIPIPFGFRERFKSTVDFKNRLNKCVALGSVNPLRPLQFDKNNFIESANFFPDDCWFHKFRRLLVLNSEKYKNVYDSMLPVFPDSKDFKYDIVEKLNSYRMFVSCESLFNFPPAKSFEGPASGTVMVCADHDCNKEYGFKDGVNCIMYQQYNIDSFIDKVTYYQKNPKVLSLIQNNGMIYVRENFTHKKVASDIYKKIENICKK